MQPCYMIVTTISQETIAGYGEIVEVGFMPFLAINVPGPSGQTVGLELINPETVRRISRVSHPAVLAWIAENLTVFELSFPHTAQAWRDDQEAAVPTEPRPLSKGAVVTLVRQINEALEDDDGGAA